VNLNFANGLAYDWNRTVATSAAKVEFSLNISSIGLKGYKFTSIAFLNMRVVASSTAGKITVTVRGDTNEVVTDLKSANIRVNNNPVFNFSSSYSPSYYLVYDMDYEGSSSPLIELWDQRGVRVVAKTV
jgi:hypothetical protein